MTIGYWGLLMIVLASMFVGCCVGVVMMAMCKVSAISDERSESSD